MFKLLHQNYYVEIITLEYIMFKLLHQNYYVDN